LNEFVLIGLILVGVVAVPVLAVIVWLVVRPGAAPTPQRASREEARPMPEPDPPQPVPQAPESGFAVTEAPSGPHPRPRELDRESRRELLLLDERLHRAFFERSGMSPEEWGRIADALLIVHDRIPAGIALERFEAATESHVSAPPTTELSPREVIATLNAQLSPERRMRPLGTLDEPVEADVYGPTMPLEGSVA